MLREAFNSLFPGITADYAVRSLWFHSLCSCRALHGFMKTKPPGIENPKPQAPDSGKCLNLPMHPDYPHKLFSDKRCAYHSLMESLAMDAAIG